MLATKEARRYFALYILSSKIVCNLVWIEDKMDDINVLIKLIFPKD